MKRSSRLTGWGVAMAVAILVAGGVRAPGSTDKGEGQPNWAVRAGSLDSQGQSVAGGRVMGMEYWPTGDLCLGVDAYQSDTQQVSADVRHTTNLYALTATWVPSGGHSRAYYGLGIGSYLGRVDTRTLHHETWPFEWSYSTHDIVDRATLGFHLFGRVRIGLGAFAEIRYGAGKIESLGPVGDVDLGGVMLSLGWIWER